MAFMGLPASQAKASVLLGLGQMMAWATCFYTLGVLAVPMAQGFGLPPNWVYAMFSVGLLCSGLVSPLAGRLLHRHGGRKLLMTSNLLFAGAQLVLATAHHPAQLAAGWVLLCMAMPLGVYEAAFATLVGLYGTNTRPAITVVPANTAPARSASGRVASSGAPARFSTGSDSPVSTASLTASRAASTTVASAASR